MKVILTKDVEHLGLEGDIKVVKPGYGRNFLLPEGCAVLATPAALKEWERSKEARDVRRAEAQAKAEELAAKVNGTELSFTRPVGEGGRLFGSVAKPDVVKALLAAGHKIDKAHVRLETPLKEVGEYEVELKLRPGVTAKIKVSVAAQS